MPKKHKKQTTYTKPPSTVPSSLSSSSTHNVASNKQDGPSSVNELLSNLRKSAKQNERNTLPTQPPTMPPSIRHLLSMQDTQGPRPRIPRHVDEFGHRLPAGPAPPTSWLAASKSGLRKPSTNRHGDRKYPESVLHLPGVKMPRGLIHLCLQTMAKDWEFQSHYNTYYLATLPTALRVLLLSYIAVYGPAEGVGFDAFKHIIHPPTLEPDSTSDFTGNDTFRRLDVSGSIGRSISFQQLAGIIMPEEDKQESEEWDNEAVSTIYKNPTPFLPFLTHLSLSFPSASISWSKFLNFAKNVPTITHLAIADWPLPTMTPNSKTATIDRHGLTIQAGGANYYSHSLDGDWSEAAGILRRLSWILYNLEWLNVDGIDWAPALCWKENGVNWKDHWSKIRVITLRSPCRLTQSESTLAELLVQSPSIRDIELYKESIVQAVEVETYIRRQRGWISVEHEDWVKYDSFLCEESRKSWEEKMNVARFARRGYEQINELGSSSTIDSDNPW